MVKSERFGHFSSFNKLNIETSVVSNRIVVGGIEMNNNTRPSLKFFVFGFALLLLSPLVILIGPLMYVESVYFDRNYFLLITPKQNFMLLGIALGLIIGSLFLLAWKRRIVTYVIVGFCIIASGITGALSFKSYTAMDEQGIIFQQYGDQQTYQWGEMAMIIYEMATPSEAGNYKFTMSNGELIEIKENGKLERLKGKIYSFASSHSIEINEIERD